MSDPPRLVLDTSVLSSFHAAGWFDGLDVWTPGYHPVTSDRIWREEFVPHHDVTTAPDWLTVAAADLDDVQSPAGGQLSVSDWTCIALATGDERAQVVTNDAKLHAEADGRDIATLWGTKLAILTFERCGVTERTFRSGIPTYVEDVHLPEAVADEVRSAEKPDD